MLTVQKFGGSSVADAGKIKRVAGIIAERARDGGSVVVVLSARGDTTDELISDAASISSEPPKRELDVLLSTGELSSVALMAMQLAKMGLNCVSLSGRQAGIITDVNHGEAKITNINTDRISRELGAGRILLVAGFQGVSENDDITTLGRGGSDTTAVALAAALHADRCEIYSDVDGIYTADPRLVTGARKMDAIDYEDMLRLSLGGSQVLHSRSVAAAMKYGVEVWLLSSYVSAPGTRLARLDGRPDICGITRDKALSRISIVGKGVGRRTLAEAVAALSQHDILTLSADTGDGVCELTVEPQHVMPAMEILHKQFFLSLSHSK